MTHPTYPVKARIPTQWTATVEHNDITNVDVWRLAQSSAPTSPQVFLMLSRLPRQPRHSAFFPGDVPEDRSAERIAIAGREMEVMVQNRARSILVDFESDTLAVSINAFIPEPAQRSGVLEVLRQLEFD